MGQANQPPPRSTSRGGSSPGTTSSTAEAGGAGGTGAERLAADHENTQDMAVTPPSLASLAHKVQMTVKIMPARFIKWYGEWPMLSSTLDVLHTLSTLLTFLSFHPLCGPEG